MTLLDWKMEVMGMYISKEYFITDFAKDAWIGLVQGRFFAPPKHSHQKFGFDYRLAIQHGAGVVKYIDTETDNDSSDLPYWNGHVWGPNANDGTFDGQTLFQTKMERDDSQCSNYCRPSPMQNHCSKKEEAGGNHVLLHSSEERDVTLIESSSNSKQTGRREVKLGQTSATITTRIAETSKNRQSRNNKYQDNALMDILLKIVPDLHKCIQNNTLTLGAASANAASTHECIQSHNDARINPSYGLSRERGLMVFGKSLLTIKESPDL
ncbi:hypothetical protein RFI_21838 [Reticulomyxa filosa]|uniref:Uncharacterized protein n=1 Tax=Reticulomyxa filosa TaxID=46433 RepID=X6MQ19_RETFI|nr:hypothetical protein RFI_21838 [Reticulomyxa filosa]|eukprot:ETO15527.1 hypothetical protein RFI_21838 [Reticulomyxa filosa]